MLWFGRERLAEGAYEKAMAELSKPNPDSQRALWLLDCSTNLNPVFREAIELKQTLNSKEITSVDNASIHSFIRTKILADKNMSVPTPKLPGSVRIDEPAPSPMMAPTTRPVSMKTSAPSPAVVAVVEPKPSAGASIFANLLGKSPTTLPATPKTETEIVTVPAAQPLLEGSPAQSPETSVSAIETLAGNE
jgi:hypothetical protein